MPGFVHQGGYACILDTFVVWITDLVRYFSTYKIIGKCMIPESEYQK